MAKSLVGVDREAKVISSSICRRGSRDVRTNRRLCWLLSAGVHGRDHRPRGRVRVVAGEDALYGDALGPPGSDGDTYLKMVRHNTRTMASNLGGA
jgi:hypothetical protein